MDRLERLVNLVAALIDTPRPLTRSEIRERIDGYSPDPEAFRRNFERDKDLLRQMGFPLVTEVAEGSNPEDAGYRIPRELYELPDPGLDEDELTALRLAASVVQMEGDWSQALVGALRKLGGAAGGSGQVSGGTARGPTLPAASLPAQAAAATVFAAVGERRRVEFTYRDQARVVDPWRLSYARGHWYLSGWDHARGEERQFRLDRVKGDVVAAGPAGAFERPGAERSSPPPPWRMGDEDETVVTVWFDAEQSPWAARALGPGVEAAAGADGTTVFRIPVTNRSAMISFVLGFLDHAEILGPPEVRAEIQSWLEGVR